eukprot:tig00020603_g11797.t1
MYMTATTRDCLAGRGLAALKSLEYLKILDYNYGCQPLESLIVDLASGPAGRSLNDASTDHSRVGSLLLGDDFNEDYGIPALSLNGGLVDLAAAFTRSTSLTEVDLRMTRGRGRLSLEMPVLVDPNWGPEPAELAAALAAFEFPPRRLVLLVRVSEEAQESGWLDGLSAFAGCSEDIEEDC